MAQNIYDDTGFFAGYSRLERSVAGLDGAPEWPALRALLPPLAGARVVDLGCGFGWFCRWAAEQGAAQVLGLDVSRNMLARAVEATPSPAVSYRIADLDQLALPAGAFDVAYSSLAFHYVADIRPLFRTIHDALAPGGHLVFSTEHPIYMAPTSPEWTTSADGRSVWPLDGYLNEGARRTNWLAEGVLKYHRTLGTTLSTLIASGFVLTHVEEWGPDAAQVAARPEWNIERERPMFLLIAARREG